MNVAALAVPPHIIGWPEAVMVMVGTFIAAAMVVLIVWLSR